MCNPMVMPKFLLTTFMIRGQLKKNMLSWLGRLILIALFLIAMFIMAGKINTIDLHTYYVCIYWHSKYLLTRVKTSRKIT